MTEQNSPFQTLLDALPSGAALIGRDGRIAHAHERLCAMMGRSKADVIGADLLALYAADAEAANQIGQVIRDFHEPHESEFYLPRPDGTRLPVLSSARPLEGTHADLRLLTMIDL